MFGLGAYLLGHHQPHVLETATLVGLVVVAAVVSFHTLENPARHRRTPALRGLRALVLGPVVIALVLATGQGAADFATHRFEARIAGGSAAGEPDPTLLPRAGARRGEGAACTGSVAAPGP